MRIFMFISLTLILLACGDSSERPPRLAQVEAKSYTGYVAHTKYEYDNMGRIITITRTIDNEAPTFIATISYNGNEATILSSPKSDPSYNQTTEVRLTINAAGLTEKRIAYTHKVPADPDWVGETFVYDTLLVEYIDGFVSKTVDRRYDSTWVSPTRNRVGRSTWTAIYTTEAGNLTAIDELVVYPRADRDGTTTTLSGGSSEYHTVFNYAKSYPNKTDFKNAAVLNEYKEYYEPFLNMSYKNMPDQYVITAIDKNLDGAVIFTITSTIDMERIYNNGGLLSTMKIPANTQYREINYFYQ